MMRGGSLTGGNAEAWVSTAEVGAVYVDAGSLGASAENKAIGLFAHDGVANHPGDLGMRRLAELILAGFEKVK